MTATPEIALGGDAGARTPSFMPNGPLVRIHANLMPDEIIIARRLRRLQRRLAAGVVGLVVLLGGGYGYSMWQTSQANSDLDGAKAQAARLDARESSFNALVQLQAKTTALQTQLQSVMANSLEWNQLLGSINKAAAGQISVNTVSGSTNVSSSTAAAGSTGTPGTLSSSGSPSIGQLTLTGDAPNLSAVAAFVQRLAAIKGFADVLPADTSSGSTTGSKSGLDYTINISLTSDILGGRFNKIVSTGNPATPPAGTTNGGR